MLTRGGAQLTLATTSRVYCLIAILAFARLITLSQQQHQQQQSYQQQNHQLPQQQQQQSQNAQQPSSRELISQGSSQQRQNVTQQPHEGDFETSPLDGGSFSFQHNSTSTRNRDYNREEPVPASIAATLMKRKLSGSASGSSVARRSSNGSRAASTRIETLDDVSHRLDQTPVNVPLELDDTRVPFWNIAHMINSIEQIDLALRAGSNGIETDISFDASGRPVEAYHGFPCDCGRHCHHREDFVKFVQYVAQLTLPPASSRLFLVLFDLKLKDLKEIKQKETAGALMAEILHKNLYEEYSRRTSVRSRSALEQNLSLTPPVRVIISINHVHDLPLTRAFLAYMQRNRLDFMSQFIGWDVGMNDPLENITSGWDSLGRGGGTTTTTTNIWQGDGLTNCANIVRGSERLKGAISIRNNQGHFRKVYYWTADVLYHIRSVLRLGLDAILTNQPQRAIQVLQEPEFRNKYRLATPYDDPFMQFWIKASASKLPSFDEIHETVQNIQKTGGNFIKTIPDGVAAAIKKVSSSIG